MRNLATGKAGIYGVDADELDEPAVITESTEEEPRARSAPEWNRGYSWLEEYIPRIEGKEARNEYYARLG